MAPLGAVWENDFYPRPAARNRFPTFHQSTQTERKSNAYFFWWTANAVDTDLPFKRGEIVLQALGSNSEVGAKLQPPPGPPNTNLREKGAGEAGVGGGVEIIFNSGFFRVNGFSTILKLGVGKVLLSWPVIFADSEA